MKRFALIAGVALATLGATTDASAFEWFNVGVGPMGQVGAVFLDKPGNQNLPGFASPPRPLYPGFAGLHAGGGGFVDIRFFDAVGLEFAVLRTLDSGRAEKTITNTTTNQTTIFDIEIRHSAWHLPLLLKGSIPGEMVQPNMFIGPEFVIPGDAETEVLDQPSTNIGGTSYSATASDYVTMTFGFGIEFKIPLIKGEAPGTADTLQLRIPFTIRGSFNPGVSSERSERGTHTVNGQTLVGVNYATDWKFKAAGNLGVGVYF